MFSNGGNAVKQAEFEIYYPNWDKPDEIFYRWRQESRLIGYFDKCFAGGGYKLLYRVAGVPQVLAKYKSTKFDACATEKEVLKYSSAIRSLWQRLMPWQKELIGRVMCLPIAVCRDKQGRCSLLLPLMEDVFLSEEWQTCDVLNPKLFADQEYKVPAKNYFAMAFELAKVFASLHNNDFIHGDISDRNIRLYPPAGKVYIIDCDNLSTGEMAMPLMTEDFVTPELAQGRTLGVPTEDYALAIFLYSLLLHRHPLRPGRIPTKHVGANEKAEWIFGTDALYVEADNGNNYTERRLANEYRIDQVAVVDHKYRFAFPLKTPAEKIVGKRLADMFRQAFTSGVKDPKERPSAQKWAEEIYKVMCRMIPCDNIFCPSGWIVPGDSGETCPHCGRNLVRHMYFCLYRSTGQDGRYMLDCEDGISIYDFRSLYEINFRSWNDIFTSGCETGERLGTFQVDTDAADRFFFVSDSSKKIVFARLDKTGGAISDCVECVNGGRTDLLAEGTVLFQPDNPEVVLYFPYAGTAPLNEISLPLTLMRADGKNQCPEDWCRTPVPQKWKDWRDVWKCNDRAWLLSGGVPLGKCLSEIKLIQTELQNEWRNYPDHKNVCDCSRIDLCSDKLEILARLVQSDMGNIAEILIGSLKNHFKQVEESSKLVKSTMMKTIDRIVGAKK